MTLTRRSFLKMGCLSVGVLVGGSLLGCASEQSASSGNAGANTTAPTAANTENAPAATPEASAPQVTGSIAVVFFSCTGNTEAVAEKIATATDGTLMRIEAADPYTADDLNYNTDCRANAEQNSGTPRPELAVPIPDIASYDTVYLGYPIWWGKAPRIILTYLESTDTAGKTLIPFCTSGSSPITGSISEVEAAAPNAIWLEGSRFSSSASQQEIDAWVASN